MELSFYHASVPVFDRTLQNVETMLGKALVHARHTGVPEDALLALRVHRDMLPLGVQVDILCSGVRGATARLSGRLAPDDDSAGHAVFNRGDPAQFSQAPTRFGAASAMLAEARAYLAPLTEADMAQVPGTIDVCMGGWKRSFTSRDFLLHYVLPNLHFHATVIYALLRGADVALGKADFEGRPVYLHTPVIPSVS